MMGSLPTHSKSTKLIFMKTFTATLCLTLTILIGSVGVSASAAISKRDMPHTRVMITQLLCVYPGCRIVRVKEKMQMPLDWRIGIAVVFILFWLIASWE